MTLSRHRSGNTVTSYELTDPEVERDAADRVRCDRCSRVLDGAPAGSGLFIWVRGDEIRYEEPPLCEPCAEAVVAAARTGWEEEEDVE